LLSPIIIEIYFFEFLKKSLTDACVLSAVLAITKEMIKVREIIEIKKARILIELKIDALKIGSI